MYKLIAIDLDGTLLDDRRNVSDETIAVLREADARGIRVVLCSGRAPTTIKRFYDILGLTGEQYAIGFNGAAVYENSKSELLRAIEIRRERAFEILRGIKDFHDCGTILYQYPGKVYFDRLTPFMQDYLDSSRVEHEQGNLFEIVKTDLCKMLWKGTNENLHRLEAEIRPILPTGMNLFYTDDTLLEITEHGATKGGGLEYLCKHLNIPLSQTIGFGDHENDIPLLETAGLGIAMKNAKPAVKATADHITRFDNNNDGVAEAIKQFVF